MKPLMVVAGAVLGHGHDEQGPGRPIDDGVAVIPISGVTWPASAVVARRLAARHQGRFPQRGRAVRVDRVDAVVLRRDVHHVVRRSADGEAAQHQGLSVNLAVDRDQVLQAEKPD